jgi:hypothetical protein
MVEALLSSEKYAVIKKTVYDFLYNASRSFGSNSNFFSMYLLHLLLATDHRNKITNVPPDIQLLLANPHVFWPPMEGLGQEDSTLKTKVIKYFILKCFSTFLAKNGNSIRNKPKMLSFIEDVSQNLTAELQRMGIEHLNVSNFRQVNIYSRQHLRGFSISLLMILTAGLLSLLVAKGGRYFVDEIALKNTQIDCDRAKKDIKFEAFSLVVILSMTFWISSSLLGSYFLDRYKVLDSNSHFLGWQELTMNELIAANMQRSEIRALLGRRETDRLDDAWSRWSHLTLLNESKSPAMLRSYCQFELNLLQHDMEFSEFCKFLTCLLFEDPPLISDGSYSPPQILRRPENVWTSNTKLARKNCAVLLQHYIHLAIIDYLEDEVKITPVKFNKDQFLKLLSEKREYIKNILYSINNRDLSDKFLSEDIKILIYGFIMLMGAVISGSMFYFKFHNFKELDPNCRSNKLGSGSIWVFPLLAFIKTWGVYDYLLSLLTSDKNSRVTKSVSLQFFTENVITKSDELKAIFDADCAHGASC